MDIGKTMYSDSIKPRERVEREESQFMAQKHHESKGFKSLVEDANYRVRSIKKEFKKYFRNISDEEIRNNYATVGVGKLSKEEKIRRQTILFNKTYGGRLGNSPEEGYKYRGRGYIQLTGKENYEKAGRALGLDLVNKPELAENPKNADRIAKWYWEQRVKSKMKNEDWGDTKKVTRLVRGSSDSHIERNKLYLKYLNINQVKDKVKYDSWKQHYNKVSKE